MSGVCGVRWRRSEHPGSLHDTSICDLARSAVLVENFWGGGWPLESVDCRAPEKCNCTILTTQGQLALRNLNKFIKLARGNSNIIMILINCILFRYLKQNPVNQCLSKTYSVFQKAEKNEIFGQLCRSNVSSRSPLPSYRIKTMQLDYMYRWQNWGPGSKLGTAHPRP